MNNELNIFTYTKVLKLVIVYKLRHLKIKVAVNKSFGNRTGFYRPRVV